MDFSLPGSSVHGIFQARILEWVAISSSKGSSQLRGRTRVLYTAGGFFTLEPPGNSSLPFIHMEIHRSLQCLSWLFLASWRLCDPPPLVNNPISDYPPHLLWIFATKVLFSQCLPFYFFCLCSPLNCTQVHSPPGVSILLQQPYNLTSFLHIGICPKSTGLCSLTPKNLEFR